MGKKAITESGLVYYIGSDYRSDGDNAWVTLSTGVDSDKIAPLSALLSAELDRLLSDPPSDSEIDEAKNHRVGRFRSASQSNAELATQLAKQWLWYGELLDAATLNERLDAISRQDIIDAIASFRSGKHIIVSQ
jgi:predicted Zn-dependent peptidase